MRRWFPASALTRDQAGGVRTNRVSGRLDLDVALRDLAVRRPEVQAALGLTGEDADLNERDIRELDAVAGDPRLVLEAGQRDGKLRRLAVRVSARPPGESVIRARFVVALDRVDRFVRIVAPRRGRPIDELFARLAEEETGYRPCASSAARRALRPAAALEALSARLLPTARAARRAC